METSQRIKVLEEKFPHHRFTFTRNTIVVPKNLSPDELNDLKNDLKRITNDFYELKYRPRVKQYYFAPM